MRVRRRVVVALSLALVVGAAPVLAQRGPGAPTEAELRSSLARLEARRQQLRAEAMRKDAERRDLEQQLERARREQQQIEQQLAGLEMQARQLEQALLQPR